MVPQPQAVAAGYDPTVGNFPVIHKDIAAEHKIPGRAPPTGARSEDEIVLVERLADIERDIEVESRRR